MRRMPRVSVVVSIYDVESYLATCLQSLARQTMRDLEVIMVDDGSTDGSRALAERFACQDRRFHLVGLKLPTVLRAQADEVWELVSRLADGDRDPGVADRLDGLRAAYADLYAEAEAIAQSSIAAPRTRPAAASARIPARALRIVRRVPRRYRHSVPPHWRSRIARALARSA